MKNKIVKIILIVVVVIVVIGAVGFGFASKGLSEVKSMEINDVIVSNVPDGVYAGQFKQSRWDYNVEVSVKNGKITGIQNLKSASDAASREFFDNAEAAVLGKQSIIIDTVSGATANTKSFQKAVENALTSKGTE